MKTKCFFKLQKHYFKMCLIDKDLVSIRLSGGWVLPLSLFLTFHRYHQILSFCGSFSLIFFFFFFCEKLYMLSFYVSYAPRINGQLFPTLTTTKILINTFTIMMQVEKFFFFFLSNKTSTYIN